MNIPIETFRGGTVRVGEPLASAVTLPVREPCDVNSMFARQNIKSEVTRPYNHEGTIAVACVWVAFYAIVAMHEAIVSIICALDN